MKLKVILALLLISTAAKGELCENAIPVSQIPEGMVYLEGGLFVMGCERAYVHEEGPLHQVKVDPFMIDKTEVTNAQFKEFIDATSYKTVAERPLDPKEFPQATADMLEPGSIVFQGTEERVKMNDILQWWKWVKGASWNHPEGPESTIDDRLDHPVIHVAYEDAQAYAKWAGKRLPTEAEWEYAARGGLKGKMFSWGDEEYPEGKTLANFWQGEFPHENQLKDKFYGLAPVKSFPPNGFGLYDMAGNVWEWTADWFRIDYFAISPEDNPKGPAESHDPREPGMKKRVTKGGSYLCSISYCFRYRPGARSCSEINSATCHTGFRCVKDL